MEPRHALPNDGGMAIVNSTLNNHHQHPVGMHSHQHLNHSHVHDTRTEGLVFYSMMLGMFCMQWGLQWWRQKYPKSFRTVSLAGLWLLPAVTALSTFSLRFLLIWCAYSAAASYYVYQARRKPLQPTTPRIVYRFFDVCYTLTSQVAGVCFGAMALLVFAPPIVMILPEIVTQALVLGTLYGTYFAVLTRDLAELAAETIATNLGYAKKGDDDSARPVPRGLCALCGEDLLPAGGEEAGAEGGGLIATLARVDAAIAARESRAGAKRQTVRVPVGDGTRCVFRLECGHVFHEYCIKGWCIVGKKHICPQCVERVDLRAISGETVFGKSSLLWVQLLSLVRYLVVWMPLLMVVMRLAFWEFGVNIKGSGLDDSVAADSVNATATGAIEANNATAAEPALLLTAPH